MLGALGKDLEFPLTHHHFGVDAFDVQAGFQAHFQVLFDDMTSNRFAVTDATVVRTLRAGEAFGRETDRLVRFGIPDRVLLLETEPEIVVVVGDRRSTIGSVRVAFVIKDFAHHKEPGSHATWIGANENGLQQTIATAPRRLFGRRTVESPHRGIFDIAAEVTDDFGFASQALGGLVAVEPDVFQLALGHVRDSPSVNQKRVDCFSYLRLFLLFYLPHPDFRSSPPRVGPETRSESRIEMLCSDTFKITKITAGESLADRRLLNLFGAEDFEPVSARLWRCRQSGS